MEVGIGAQGRVGAGLGTQGRVENLAGAQGRWKPGQADGGRIPGDGGVGARVETSCGWIAGRVLGEGGWKPGQGPRGPSLCPFSRFHPPLVWDSDLFPLGPDPGCFPQPPGPTPVYTLPSVPASVSILPWVSVVSPTTMVEPRVHLPFGALLGPVNGNNYPWIRPRFPPSPQSPSPSSPGLPPCTHPCLGPRPFHTIPWVPSPAFQPTLGPRTGSAPNPGTPSRFPPSWDPAPLFQPPWSPPQFPPAKCLFFFPLPRASFPGSPLQLSLPWFLPVSTIL
ncbi:hypothetical protein HOLleu_36356 [Holothuria leucospilota]|uniref:Uncharacterized protein n=1 Tax=Holothuria leucospilota TaxID=206669 RepID=A0A9Q0YJU2_HOLLE|nr:hypothetical protein HOLleu_36356 [Holothuria leucospilota]